MSILSAELLKVRKSNAAWITFLAFSLVPVMGGVFILILKDPEALSHGGALKMKAEMINFIVGWPSYFMLLTNAIGVGGILIFGFVASWIFGREYSDGTVKDILFLPSSRAKILNAKFVVFAGWCALLAISNFTIGILVGTLTGLTGLTEFLTVEVVIVYLLTTILTLLVSTPGAFFSIAGEGYLAPLGFVALALVLSQIIAAAGFGTYFPWAIPGIYSGAAGDYRNALNFFSYAILIFASLAGYAGAMWWFLKTDQTK